MTSVLAASRRRGVAVAVLVLGLVALLVAVAAGLSRSGTDAGSVGAGTRDRVRTTVSVTAPRPAPMPGETFSMTGQVSSRPARPVRLEEQGPQGWAEVAQATTGQGGRFIFADLRLREETTYRVAVPPLLTPERRFIAARSGATAVSPVPQRVDDLALLPPVAAAGPRPEEATPEEATTEEATTAGLLATATLSPPRPGREVHLDSREAAGSPWQAVGTAVSDEDGQVVLGVSGPPAAEYRAVAQAYHGASVRASAPRRTPWWAVSFAEDFGATLDSSLWSIRGEEHEPASSRTCARADPSMVDVEGGVAHLDVRREAGRTRGTCAWSNETSGDSGTDDWFLNAHIGTQDAFSFRYGVAAARVRFQKPRGMHGAFWLQDSGEGEGTRGAEVDVVEFFGADYPRGGVAHYVYPQDGDKSGGVEPGATAALSGPRDQWWRRYHVFSVEWRPEELVFRIDGTETFSTTDGVPDRKAFVILSLLSSDWELRKMPASGAGSMAVDWVRVWQDPALASLNR